MRSPLSVGTYASTAVASPTPSPDGGLHSPGKASAVLPIVIGGLAILMVVLAFRKRL